MNSIRVVPIGAVERPLLDAVVHSIAAEFRLSSSIGRISVDPAFAYHSERSQFHSTMLLEHLIRHASGARLLGVTAVDLYIPILTFVFGEAQLDGGCAVVSHFRLRQELYGLPADEALLRERLVKEALHEVGHTFGLTHCDDYECAMAASHSVEWLDLKRAALCEECRESWRDLAGAASRR